MRNPITIFTLTLFLLLAGCGGTPTVEDTPTVESLSTSTPTEPSTLTRTPTVEPPENAWNSEQIKVGFEINETARQASYGDVTRQLVDYLNTYAETNTGHEGKFVLTQDSDSADILIRFTPVVRSCGTQTANISFRYCPDRDVTPQTTHAGQRVVAIPTVYTISTIETFTKTGVMSTLGLEDPEATPRTEYNRSALYPYHDPWRGQNKLVVGIENPADTSANMIQIVQSSIEYWEQNDKDYGMYEANWTLDPDAQDPDMVVRFVENISVCGPYPGEDVIGCASLLKQSLAEPPEVVRVEVGYTEASTINTTKHEFGHLYGLNHSSRPQPLMSAVGDAEFQPVQNASERKYPFNKSSLAVYISDKSSELRRNTIVTETSRALDYYASGAEGYVPSNTSFTIIENRSEADIIVSVGADENKCQLDAGSCPTVAGENLDSDRSLEVYTELTIYVYGIPEDRLAWHIGAQMTYLSSGGSPPPFDGERDDRDGWYR